MLPAFTVKCDCAECQRSRQHSAMLHRFYGVGSPTGNPFHTDPFHSAQVNEPLCSGGCETHGECADAGMTCSYCDECDYLCSCDKCGNCGGLIGDDCECCPSCGSSYSCSYCGDCDEPSCNCSCESDSYYGSGDARFGTIKVAPWVARGVSVDPVWQDSARAARDAWNVDQSIDLCQSAADFYLLEALTGNVVNAAGDLTGDDAYLSLLRSEAKELFAAHVARLDRSFMGYLDMIIGGELRHHRAAGSTNLRNTSRKGAWNEWHAIRQAGGTQVLRDAVDLFIDFHSTSYGGEAWAQIARVLLARVEGRISPAVFVDRVWNLQHNGGTCFDKISWSVDNRLGWGMSSLNQWILPAHGAKNPWPLLLSVASPAVRELFTEYWRSANRVRTAIGMRPERMPETRVPMRRGYWGDMEIDHNAAMALLGH